MNKLSCLGPKRWSKLLQQHFSVSSLNGHSIDSLFPSSAIIATRKNFSSSSSSFSAAKFITASPAICLSKDGSTFLAYHPQRDFPYEHSRPLPTPTEAVDDVTSTSPLKVQITKAFREKTDSKKLTNKDLENMFGECRNYFRPQPQETNRKEVAEYNAKLKRKTLNELPED